VLLWSGEEAGSVVIAPRSLRDAIEQQVRTEAPEAEFLPAEVLVEGYARSLDPANDAAPVEVDDDVQFTVYRPRAVRPETTERLVAFAHKTDEYEEDGRLVDPIGEMGRQAAEVLGDLSRHVTSARDSDLPVARGDTLRFEPIVPGLSFNPSALEFQWLRGVHREVFEFRADRRLDGQTLNGRLSVYLGLRLVGDVSLRIRVDSGAAGPEQDTSRGRVYGKVFPSYSHQDAVVVDQIATAASSLGHQYLRDVERLRAGQDWQAELERYIDEADIFQLFWSPASMNSPHVQHEWDYALSLNRPDFVRPVFWEQPRPSAPPHLPPPELDRLHFAYLGGLAPPEAPSEPAFIAPPEPVSAPPAPAPAAAAPAAAAPAAPPPDVSPRREARRGIRGALAGVGLATVAGIAVTVGVTGGGAPVATSPPGPSATSSTSSTSFPTSASSAAGSPAPTSSPQAPSSSEARQLVTEFFSALDTGDPRAASRLLCPSAQDQLRGDLRQLATYDWGTPRFVGEEVVGSDRVLRVVVHASDGSSTATQRLRVLVSSGPSGAQICGLEAA
jgi:hypothetical protein